MRTRKRFYSKCFDYILFAIPFSMRLCFIVFENLFCHLWFQKKNEGFILKDSHWCVSLPYHNIYLDKYTILFRVLIWSLFVCCLRTFVCVIQCALFLKTWCQLRLTCTKAIKYLSSVQRKNCLWNKLSSNSSFLVSQFHQI